MPETDLNLTANPSEIAGSTRGAPDSGLVRQPYDPARDRERIRGWMAVGLTALLIGVVSAVIYGVLSKTIPLNELDKFAAILITPVIGLIGAVLGFYFGQKS